jgi:hypothetical protein
MYVRVGLSQIEGAERAHKTALIYAKTETDRMKTSMKNESGKYISLNPYSLTPTP